MQAVDRMAALEGFTFECPQVRQVVIRHFGHVAAVLRGRLAASFLVAAETANDIGLQSGWRGSPATTGAATSAILGSR